MTNLALIPCRGGSKGIPRKNLQTVHGVPLVIRAINSCFDGGIDEVYVSTDDGEISNYAIAAGAKVIERPSEFAQDTSSTDDVLKHAIDSLIGMGYLPDDLLLILQATSPFTQAETVRKSLNQLQAEPKAGVFSVVEWHGFVWNIESKGVLPHHHDHQNRRRRQDLSPKALETGGIYGAQIKSFMSSGVRFVDPLRPIYVGRAEAVEIDSWDDLDFCNRISAPLNRGKQGKIKVLFSDFDGVFTDNRVQQLEKGESTASVNRSDGIAANTFASLGIPVIIITGENQGPAFGRAKKLEIDCLSSIDKLRTIIDYCTTNDILLSEVAYVGNDLNDLDSIATCGWTFAPYDSHPQIIKFAKRVLRTKGGEGVIREISDLLFS
jgi:N-acylneuraminate cytidylyltransferase